MTHEIMRRVSRDVAVATMLTCMLTVLPVRAADAKNTVYDHPRFYSNGLPIDYCLYPAKQCGHAAADRYCKDMNAGSVIDFKWERSDSGTYIQGTGDTCDTKKFNQCIALTQIVCGHFTL